MKDASTNTSSHSPLPFNTGTLTLDAFTLQNGQTFRHAPVTYTQYGTFTGNKKTALFFHAFSCNSELHTWWKKFDFHTVCQTYDILSINCLGSCHGSLGPASQNPNTGHIYGAHFPMITIVDTIEFTIAALKALGIYSLDVVLGCSLGGMQCLEMYLRYPQLARTYISMCGGPLPLMSRMMNLAQCNLIHEAISQNLSQDMLQMRLSFARYFFRLTCATEYSLHTLAHKQRTDGTDLDAETLECVPERCSTFQTTSNSSIALLDRYLQQDGLDYPHHFSPHSFHRLKQMVSHYDLPEHVVQSTEQPNAQQSNIQQPQLIMIDIDTDQYATPASIESTYQTLIHAGKHVQKMTFSSQFGHEAWIVDGKRCYQLLATLL